MQWAQSSIKFLLQVASYVIKRILCESFKTQNRAV